MATMVIGNKTFTQFPAGATRTAGSYWMRAPHPAGEAREMEDITAEATDGVEKVDHGFRGRVLGPIMVMVVASSDSALVTAYKTILTAVENKPNGITIVMPYGETYINSYVMSGFPRPIGPREADETGTVYQIVELMFTQDRET
jgi:hypothetical protein